jgi:ribosomal protein L7Ae-like RNA K-turn-binding protein
MANDPILHLLGLAKKAGKLEIGEEPVGAVCRSRHARLLLLAKDAAPNTCRRAAHFGEAGNVLWLQLPHTKEELGFLLGRKSCAMVAVTDFGIAGAIGEKLALLDQRYAPAAEQLRTKADRALQRQKEKRQHEKNVQMGKKKPWAAPANQEGEKKLPKKEKQAAGKQNTGSRDHTAAARADKGSARPAPRKPGLGGKKLTAKITTGGKRPSKP